MQVYASLIVVMDHNIMTVQIGKLLLGKMKGILTEINFKLDFAIFYYTAMNVIALCDIEMGMMPIMEVVRCGLLR